MDEINNNYFMDLAAQLSYMSAFLGGFSATILVTLLVSDNTKRITNWIVLFSTVAACSFIVATLSFITAGIMVHPNAPESVRDEAALTIARTVSSYSLLAGIITLLLGIGLSGWLRSKKLGIMTSSIAGIGLILVLWGAKSFK